MPQGYAIQRPLSTLTGRHQQFSLFPTATGWESCSHANRQFWQGLGYVKEFPPPAAVARDQLKFATAALSTYQTGRVRKLLDDAIQATLVGTKTAGEALGSAQKQSERLLKRYR